VNRNEVLQKAHAYAFLLLKFRPRSEKEISERLKKKGFSEEAVRQTVAFLVEKRFLDDAAFSKAWIGSRITRGMGLKRIAQELKVKGVSQEVIQAQFESLQGSYDETAAIGRICQERIGRLKGMPWPTVKRRVYAYLMRRGFSAQRAQDALNGYSL
jgi:regulatory protein